MHASSSVINQKFAQNTDLVKVVSVFRVRFRFLLFHAPHWKLTLHAYIRYAIPHHNVASTPGKIFTFTLDLAKIRPGIDCTLTSYSHIHSIPGLFFVGCSIGKNLAWSRGYGGSLWL